jgi:hypothetical protein
MGLDVTAGYLSDIAHEDEEALEDPRPDFQALSDAVVAVGLKPHLEPETLPTDRIYAERVGGYGSLHYARRLAAWLALERRLPPPLLMGGEAGKDPVLQTFYNAHHLGIMPRRPISLSERLLGWAFRRQALPPSTPPYEHLIVHSDCEGYYLPQDFERVIMLADAEDARLQMIGSAPRLLAECRTLAEAIALPDDFDPDADEPAEPTPAERAAEPWRAYPVESRVLSILMQACRASIENGAAVVFH